MDAFNHFHLFPKLPPKLRLAIWELQRESKQGIRHYFLVNHVGRNQVGRHLQKHECVNACMDTNDGRFVDNHATSGKAIIEKPACTQAGGLNTPIELPGRVGRVSSSAAVARGWRRRDVQTSKSSRPAFVDVNLGDDVFVFNNAESGWLQLLCKPIRAYEP
ncbi:Uu.00g140000.m01.CDS01 [Anthostomella pinea]|uniref:Uu.00g140000.m01.CDS01 n=1 Tax=Anthostomella pinea TaxID=933095 RepID=A0AAI8YLD2_9PEZI|nr:Uu.00g140000.m01.CDS01 [Anthostomella pinea]